MRSILALYITLMPVILAGILVDFKGWEETFWG